MNSKPLSYDSLRTVLQHSEANFRFRLVSQCPSLRNVDKNVPLYIDSLELNRNYECVVNDIQYELHIIEFSREGPTSQIVLDRNKESGFNQQDIDRFGFKRPSYRFVKTPGDIIINPLEENWDQWDDQDEAYDEEMRQNEKDMLERSENEMKDVKERNLYDLKPNPHTGDPNVSYGEQMQWLIDYQNLVLSPYTYRDQDIDSPYDRYVELRRGQQNSEESYLYDEIRPFETVKYTRKLYETMKYFMTRLFGGRGHSIHVKLLTVGAWDQIIRLPEGVKFNVQKIFTMGNPITLFDALLPVIDENCIPWKHVKTQHVDALDGDHFKKADEITLFNADLDSLDIIRGLTNQKVYISVDGYYQEEEMYDFIQHWLDNGKRVGTCYEIAFVSERNIMKILDKLEQMFEKEVTIDIDKGLMILPMKNYSKLHISYGKPTEDDYFEDSPTWVFKLEVVSSDLNLKREHESNDAGNKKRARIEE